jgi:hypothetical protein
MNCQEYRTKPKTLTWNDGSVDFRLPPQTEYRVRPGVFESHHCVKGGVDFLRLGEEVFYKPKHNDKKNDLPRIIMKQNHSLIAINSWCIIKNSRYIS